MLQTGTEYFKMNNGADFNHELYTKDYLVLARYNYEANEIDWGHRYLTKALTAICNKFENE